MNCHWGMIREYLWRDSLVSFRLYASLFYILERLLAASICLKILLLPPYYGSVVQSVLPVRCNRSIVAGIGQDRAWPPRLPLSAPANSFLYLRYGRSDSAEL